MLRINMQMTNGRSFHRLYCIVISSLVLFTGVAAPSLQAEMIAAVQKTGSSQLRGMIDDSGSAFDRLIDWTEFDSENIVTGAQANSSVFDIVDSQDGHVSPDLIFLPIVAAFPGAAPNSLGSSSNGPPVHAAILQLRSASSYPVLLLYWRGREFFRILNPPSSGLFRPPRQSLLDSMI